MYDPEKGPDMDFWRDADESERLSVMEEYHLNAGIELPNLTLHAAMHVVVENQLSEDLTAAVRTLDRLVAQGVTRHDAVHAIGSVMSEHMYRLMRGTIGSFDRAAYARDLDALDAQIWAAKP